MKFNTIFLVALVILMAPSSTMAVTAGVRVGEGPDPLPLTASNCTLVLNNGTVNESSFSAERACHYLKAVPSGLPVSFHIENTSGNPEGVMLFELAEGTSSLTVVDENGARNSYKRVAGQFIGTEGIPNGDVCVTSGPEGEFLQMKSGAPNTRKNYTAKSTQDSCCDTTCDEEEVTPTNPLEELSGSSTQVDMTIGDGCCGNPDGMGQVSLAFADYNGSLPFVFTEDHVIYFENYDVPSADVIELEVDYGNVLIKQWRTADSLLHLEIRDLEMILTSYLGQATAVNYLGDYSTAGLDVSKRIVATLDNGYPVEVRIKTFETNSLDLTSDVTLGQVYHSAIPPYSTVPHYARWTNHRDVIAGTERVFDEFGSPYIHPNPAPNLYWHPFKKTSKRQVSSGAWEVVDSEQYEYIWPIARIKSKIKGSATATPTLYDRDLTGKLESVCHPDGNWVCYADSNTNASLGVDLEIRPFQDTPFPGANFNPETADLSSYLVTGYAVEAVGGSGDMINRKMVHYNGQLISKTEVTLQFADNETETDLSITKRYSSGTDFLESSLESFPLLHSDPLLRGKPIRRVNEDQTTVLYSYEMGNWDAATSTWTPAGNGPASNQRTSMTSGAIGSENGIANQSTRTHSYRNLAGDLVATQLAICSAVNQFTVVSTTLHEELSDPAAGIESTTVTKDGRTVSLTIEDTTANLTSTTDEIGQEKIVQRNPDGELDTITTKYTHLVGVGDKVVKYTYNGLTTSVQTTWDGRVTTSSSTRNLEGRLVKSVDELGRVTDYEYPDPQTRIIKRLGVPVSKQVSYIDGSHKQSWRADWQGSLQNSPLVLMEQSSRQILVDGNIEITQIPTGFPQKKTVADWRERTLTQSSNGVTQTHSHDSKGRLSKVTSSFPGMPAELTFYDLVGNVTKSGRDLNGDDILDLNLDRAVEMSRQYIDLNGVWWSESTTTTSSGVSGQLNVSTQRQRIGFSDPTMLSQSVSVSPDLSTVTQTVSVDRATGTVTSSTLDSRLTGPSVSVSTDGMVVSRTSPLSLTPETWQYQSAGTNLVTTHTSFKGGKTVTTTNARGQMIRVKNPVNDQVVYAYHLAGSVGEGQLKSENNSMAETTFYGYDLLGQTISVTGASYPIAYQHDAQGRMVNMTTETAAGPSATLWFYDSITGHLRHKIPDFASSGIIPGSGGDLVDSQVAGKGTSYGYDDLGRRVYRKWARNNAAGQRLMTSYVYNGVGDLTNVAHNDNGITPDVTYSGHDLLGRPTVVSQAGIGSVTYSYDPIMLRTTLISGRVSKLTSGDFGWISTL